MAASSVNVLVAWPGRTVAHAKRLLAGREAGARGGVATGPARPSRDRRFSGTEPQRRVSATARCVVYDEPLGGGDDWVPYLREELASCTAHSVADVLADLGQLIDRLAFDRVADELSITVEWRPEDER